MDFVLLSGIASISMLGAMSPGPDFAVVMRNTLNGTARDGVKTAFGIAFALLVHLSYILFGLAIILQDSPTLLRIIQYIGATYLFYLGVGLLRPSSGGASEKRKWVSSPFISGFLCNLLNPKAMLFMLALFTQIINAKTSLTETIIAMSLVVITSLCWFVFLSYSISHPLFKTRFDKHERKISIAMGLILCTLAIRIVL